MELYPKEFHFPEFIESLAEICRIRAEQKGISLIYKTVSPFPQAVRADEKRWRQVLFNLLSNAVKFTEKGSITLIVVEALDQQWVPFATHLRQLAKGFKGKQILEFLKNTKRQNEC